MFKANSGEYSNNVISNDDFWPDIPVADFQRYRFIPTDIHDDQVTNFLISAVAEVNDELADYVASQIAKGFHRAADVPGIYVNGDNRLTAQYKKAVYARAKADLIGEYASLSRQDTHIGQDEPETAARLMAESSFALRSIKGFSRIGVSLI